MALRIEVSHAARRDAESIYLTSAEHFGLNQARAYRRAITETIDLLAMHPGIGRGEGRRTRPYPAQSHRIFYRADGVTLTVVRILHARQLPPGFE